MTTRPTLDAAFTDTNPLVPPFRQPHHLHDVSHALLTRPTADPAGHPRVPFAAAPPVWARVDALAASPSARTPFPLLPTSAACSPAVALAAACPDLFLVDATDGPALVARIADEAVRDGQRVLVLAHDPAALDRLAGLLANRGQGDVARAVGPDEMADEAISPTTVALARAERAEVLTRLTAKANELAAACERADRLRAELASPDEASLAVAELTATRARLEVEAVALRDRRAAVEGELAAPAAAPGLGGFFKKLFRGPDEAKHADAEARLKALDAELAANAAAIVAADAARQAAVDELALKRERAATELAAVPANLRDELDRVRHRVADLEAAPPVLSPDRANRVRVVVASPSAVGFDPLLTATHPEVVPLFDRLVVADADVLTADGFEAAAGLAAAWVLVGAAPANCCNAVPATCRHQLGGRVFDDLWRSLHAPLLLTENDRPLARLLPASESRGELTAEPLADRPDVELRFASTERGPVLAEVLFPAGTPPAEAKRFVAVEAGEVRLTPVADPHWADELTCRWPLAGEAGEWIDLGNGVREKLSGCGTATLAVTFDRAAGWTRESAAEWLRRHTPTHIPRTAVAR